MCTLIGLHRAVPGYDLVIGMNRDEDRRPRAGRAWSPRGGKALNWLESTLSPHGGAGTAALCVHFPGGGTVSSTILALHNADPEQHVLLYANGSPCENPYRAYSHLLRELNPGKG